ncbi:hypothetical protein MC885_013843 [Smutsia gigantea]|nr:hypothetical protein MC885_013843 [Smutsia gigantea]
MQFEEPEMKHRKEIGNQHIEIFTTRRNEVQTQMSIHKGKRTSSPTTKYVTGPEMVFEEHEVNEAI